MRAQSLGKVFGFVFLFFASSLVFYFVFKFTGRLPLGWNYLQVFLIFLVVIFSGLVLGRIFR